MNIIVTGGAGFIGSHLVDNLIMDGHNILVIDNLASGKLSNLNKTVKFENLDISDIRLNKIVESFKPNAVAHLAAQTSVHKSTLDHMLDAQTNILGSINLLKAINNAKCRNFVYVNTGGALYGIPKYLPLDENHVITPISPYGLSKWAAESYYSILKSKNQNTKGLRLANVYGPRQDADGELGVIPIFAKAMLANKPVNIYGDGNQTRDFVFVDDVVKAIKQAINTDSSFSVNISSGIGTSINCLYKMLTEIISNTKSPEYKNIRFSADSINSVLSNKKALEILHWTTKTKLRDGLKNTVEWINLNG